MQHFHSKLDLYLPVNHLDSHGNLIQHAPHKWTYKLPFGDEIHQLKDDKLFWIGFCNVGSFPATPMPKDKAQEFKTFTALYNLGVAY